MKTEYAISALDKAFSKFIRARDSIDFDWFTCITCGKQKPYEQADCGHYLGRQFYATRWNEINCAAQCRYCNRFNEGLKAAFRAALVRKYGENAVIGLEAGHKSGRKPKSYETLEIMKRIKADMESLAGK